MSEPTVEDGVEIETIVGPVESELAGVNHELGNLRLMVENVRAALEDGEHWVAVDNLRRLPQGIAAAHLELGRLLVAVERAEEIETPRR